MKKSKLISLLLALVMVIGLLPGCFAGAPADKDTTLPSKSADAFKPVTDDAAYKYGTVHGITWTWGEKGYEANEAAVKRAEEENAMYYLDTGNTRECVEFSYYNYNTLGALFENGKLPTIFSINSTEPSHLAEAGWGRDITACVEAVGINLEDFNQAILEDYTAEDGGVYGLPYFYYSMCLAVNGALYKEAGLVDADGHPIPPKTWEELIEQSDIIASKTGKTGLALSTDHHGSWCFINIAWNYGADLCVWNGDTGKYESNINTPETIAALEWYKNACQSTGLAGSSAVLDRKSVQNMLKAGECAIILETSDIAPFMTDNTKDGMKASDIYYFSMPAGPDGLAYNLVCGAGYWFSSSATDEQVIAALEYLMHTGTFAQEWDAESRDASVQTWTDKRIREIAQLPGFPVYNAPWQEESNQQLLEIAGGNGELYDFDAQFGAVFDRVQQPGFIHYEEESDIFSLNTELSKTLKAIAVDPDADCAALAAHADTQYAKQLALSQE